MHRFIPTPSHSAVELGPFTIHFYAICILLGTVTAIMVGRARYRNHGADPDEVVELAIVAIPAGIIGGRLYHVVTTPDLYFGSRGELINIFKIWDGGMGIWGAIALGTLVVWFYFRRGERSASFAVLADSLAPGILLAQAIGRWGNWFNGELFGGPTRLPWALKIPIQLRPIGYSQFETFHPTFLYESLWCFVAAISLIFLSKSKRVIPGNLFLLYIILYCLGRSWIEHLRIDQAHHLFGLRLNEWVSILVGGLAAMAFFWRQTVYEKVGYNHDR